MPEINIATWSRKEHYQFFSPLSDPYFSVTTTIDVTALYSYVKSHQLSFYYALIYLAVNAMKDIENFHYRIRGDKVFIVGDLLPSFTDLKPGSDLFSILNVKITGSMAEFSESCKRKLVEQTWFFPSEKEEENDECVYFSVLPRIHFTSITQESDGNVDDSIPRITFGKYVSQNEKLMMPICIRVNHRLMDGLHVSRFLDSLEQSIKQL